MNILVPFSGGVSSTYLLWSTLRNTQHDVHVLYISETLGPLEAFTRSRVDQILLWMVENLRGAASVDYVTSVYIPNKEMPIREGLTESRDLGYMYGRYSRMAEYARLLNCDEVWYGYDVHNTRTDNVWRLLEFYNRQTNIPIEFPLMQQNPRNSKAFMKAGGVGRFEMMEALPAELRSLLVQCERTPEPCNECNACRERDFFNNVVLPDKRPVKVWDEEYEQKGFFGRFRDQAPPDYKLILSYFLTYEDSIIENEVETEKTRQEIVKRRNRLSKSREVEKHFPELIG